MEGMSDKSSSTSTCCSMIISLLCVVGVAMGWFIDALIEGDEKDELDVVTARFGVLVVGDS